MVATDGEAVAIAAEYEHMQVVAAERDAGGKRQGAAVDVVTAVRVDEIGEARRAADAGEGHDFFLRIVELLEDLVEGGQHGEVAAAGTPRRVVGEEDLLGERGTGAV